MYILKSSLKFNLTVKHFDYRIGTEDKPNIFIYDFSVANILSNVFTLDN